MSKEINNIVIVGGGSAGWMSAATMIKAFPNKSITIIEPKNGETIGVGESTLAWFKRWSTWLGIDEKDFMPSTDAVYKLSIKFTDFYKKDSGGFHYPFGNPYTEGTLQGVSDWYIKKINNPDLPLSDYAETFFPSMALVNQNKINLNTSGKLGNFNFKQNAAYHFDATKFALWLKEKYCIPRGVNLVTDGVISIETDEDGISKLILENNKEISADLYIDCTGFKSLLLGQSLNEKFEDYGDVLPNNRAWATRIPYTDKEKEMEPYTNCTAIENGWVWNTPSWERIGVGYVYSDKYVSPEGALEEFKAHLRSSKMTIPDNNRDVDSYKYRDIKFKIGIYERTWVKNVVAIGLSAAFIEPLEGNGLFTTHEFLMKLVKSLNRESYSQWDIDAYNMATKSQFLSFIEFVGMHYALSSRDDTKYWRDISKKTFQYKVPALIPNMVHGFQELAYSKLNNNSYQSDSGVHCIATGLNYLPIDKNTLEEWKIFYDIDYEKELKSSRTFEKLKKSRESWELEASNSKSMYQYLKENIYNK
jgi:flavin-dependent dehydrogenase